MSTLRSLKRGKAVKGAQVGQNQSKDSVPAEVILSDGTGNRSYRLFVLFL